MENKNFNWRPVLGYTGGRVLATNGLDVLIGEINSDGDCVSEEDGSTVLCGITGFIKIEEMLPELKESEDERIRKELLQIAKESEDSFYMVMTPNKRERLIAWLKKQGEQPTDKVEPKFNVGDWIVQENIGVFKVIEVCESWYEVVDNKDEHYSVSFSKESMCRLWAINDAKDGDVLVAGEMVFIFNKIHGEWVNCHCSLHSDNSLYTEDYDLLTTKYAQEIFPATKKQRDLLFAKMHDAGYAWDNEKKELKKIEPKTLNADKVIEWLNNQACQGWIEDVEVDKFIEKFKKDFGL